MAIKDKHQYHVCGWMINQYHLKGNELICYSIIWSLSQLGEGRYVAGLKFLAEFMQCSQPTASAALKGLYDKKLIDKDEIVTEKGRRVFYFCTDPDGGEKESYSGGKKDDAEGVNKNFMDGVNKNFMPNNIKDINNNIKEEYNKKELSNDNSKKDLDFDSFYNFYPHKKSRGTAEKAWKKLSLKDKKEAIDKLPTYIADCVMSKREYKYPATYLNQRTWEDDFDKKEEPQTDDKWPQQKEWIDKTIPNLSSALNKIKIRAMRIICEDTDVLSILLRKLNDDGYEGEIMTAFYKAMKEWYED